MIANNWTQLFGLIIQVVAGAYVLLKGWAWWLENDLKKQELKSKETVEVANSTVEMAKHNSLTSIQVADILKNYHDVIDQLEEMKNNGNEKTTQILKLIDKIEEMVKKQIDNFTDFLMNRAK